MRAKTKTDTTVILGEDIEKIRSTIKRVPYKGAHDKNWQHDKTRKLNIPLMIGIVIAAAAFIAVGVIFLVKGMKPSDSLKGTWSYDDVTTYTFDGEGHGSLVLPLNTYEFSYTVGDGVLSIDFTDEKAEDRSYTYFLSDDVLVLTGPDGNEYRMTRVNSNS